MNRFANKYFYYNVIQAIKFPFVLTILSKSENQHYVVAPTTRVKYYRKILKILKALKQYQLGDILIIHKRAH